MCDVTDPVQAGNPPEKTYAMRSHHVFKAPQVFPLHHIVNLCAADEERANTRQLFPVYADPKKSLE